MAKIIRSNGRTFTKNDETDSVRKRGLDLAIRLDFEFAPAQSGKVQPKDLATFLSLKPDAVLRQVIAILDKTIKKRDRLSDYKLGAYEARARLAHELWELLEQRFDKVSFTVERAEAMELLRKKWAWKAHPYTRDPVNGLQPYKDKNATFLRNGFDDNDWSDLRGQWFDRFWETDRSDEPDYPKMARKIIEHLFENEWNIAGKRKVETGREGKRKMGLAKRRGQGISTSAHDPREPTRARQEPDWTGPDWKTYFYADVAAEIFEFATDPGRNDQIYASDFGAILYRHFGVFVKDKEAYGGAEKKRLWTLHNAIRKFYAKLAKSERFRRATRAGNTTELGVMLPHDELALRAILGAKNRNADISGLVRLGKLLVHGSDLPLATPEGDLGQAFQDRIEFLTTSDGQSEIKRNESFTRIWRNAVGFSQRTLRVWATADKNCTITNPQKPEDSDLTGAAVSKAAVSGTCAKCANVPYFNNDHFLSHLGILFGDKEFDEKTSRSAIFQRSESENKETLWAMLRLAATLRNRTNHFSTLNKLVDLVKSGLVVGQDAPEGFNNRRNEVVSNGALERMAKLLQFDKNLRSQALVKELNLFDFGSYTPTEHKPFLLAEIASLDSPDIASPRFISVLRQVSNLAKYRSGAENRAGEINQRLKGLARTSIESGDLTKPGPNKYRFGVMRQLYKSGFQAWLENGLDEGRVDFSQIVEEIRADMKSRTEATLHEKGLVYADADAFDDSIAFPDTNDIKELLTELLVQSITRERLDQTYKANPGKMSEVSNKVEVFRRELFAHLFAEYLSARKLDWLCEHEAKSDAPTEIVVKDVQGAEDWEEQDWHKSFYAWLYLLPNDEVSRLRHQFMKTRALAFKAATEPDPETVGVLEDMDRLMYLYTSTQGTGFTGAEQDTALHTGELFYKSPELFETVHSSDAENHDTSFSGSRRGLRQIVRFGHLDVLRNVFEKHKITDEEVNAFLNRNTTETDTLMKTRIKLRDEIINQVADIRGDKHPSKRDKNKRLADLERLVRSYQNSAADVAIHNFRANAARLNDHARLHHMMMRVVGRLMDYTLLWERDTYYIFLGLLYRQLGKGEAFSLTAVSPDGTGLVLPDGWLERAGLEKRFPNNTLPIWNKREGFAMPDPIHLVDLLSTENRKTFDRVATRMPRENQKDHAANRALEKEGVSSHTRYSQFYNKGRREIRNDFAHYNTIADFQDWQLNLTYQVNAVRSLMNYDRKLKNAVTKSIKKILANEGLEITWEMRNDRLRKPAVRPLIEEHLTMVPYSDCEHARCHIPRASIRFTSMAQAVFDFGNSGNVVEKTVNGRVRSQLIYPKALLEEVEGDMDKEAKGRGERDALNLPRAIRELKILDLHSENR